MEFFQDIADVTLQANREGASAAYDKAASDLGEWKGLVSYWADGAERGPRGRASTVMMMMVMTTRMMIMMNSYGFLQVASNPCEFK